jgi:hypothetical protein
LRVFSFNGSAEAPSTQASINTVPRTTFISSAQI